MMKAMKQKNIYRTILLAGTVILGMVLVTCILQQIGVRKIPALNLEKEITTDVYKLDGSVLHYDSNVFDPALKGERIVFHVSIPEEAGKFRSPVLGLNIYNSAVTVSDGNHVLYVSGSDPQLAAGHFLPRIVLPEGTESVQVELFQQENNTTSHFNNVWLMPAEYAWLYPIISPVRQVDAILLAAFLAISVLALLVYSIMAIRNHDMMQGVALSLFCISMTVWALGFTGTLFLFTNNMNIAPHLEYIAVYLLPVFFCAYMGLLSKRSVRLVSAWMEIYFIALFASATVQFFLGHHDGYLRLLNINNFSIIAGILVYAVLLLLKKIDAGRILKSGIMVTIVLAVMETVRTILVRNTASGSLFMNWLAEFQFTPYIIYAMETALGINYAYAVYDSYKERLQLQRLQGIAYTDDLTGLASRAAFDDRERQLLEKEGNYTIAFIDADGLKHANDTKGHSAGDALLRNTAFAIQSGCAGTGSRNYRYGGDEFLIVDSNHDRVLKAVEAMRAELNRNPEHPSASVGIARQEGKESVEEVIHRADEAMYQEKLEHHKRREDLRA